MAKKAVKKTSKKRKQAAAKKTVEDPKPDFEAALQQAAGEQQTGDAGGEISEGQQQTKDGRGGARPGAGRPRGVTDDFAAVNRLPEKPNLTLIPPLKIPFKLWAKSQGLPELALSDKEAEGLALPVTQLLEFYFPGKIPEIAWVWLMFGGSVYTIMEPRLEMLAELRAKKRAAGEAEAADRPSGRPSAPASTKLPSMNSFDK